MLLGKEVLALTYTIDFNTPSQYTLSSADQVFVNSGKAQLSELLTQRGQALNGPNTIENPNQVVVSGNYAYIGSYSNGGIQVFDISTPASPVRVWGILPTATNLLYGIADMEISGNYLYATSYTNDAFVIINITTPSTPTYVTKLINTGTTRLDWAWGIHLDGNYAYVASNLSDALEIINITTPTAPIHAGSLQSLNLRLDGARDVVVSGNYAYVTSEVKDRFQVIDITTKTAPAFSAEVIHNGTTIYLDGAWGIDISWTSLYVASLVSDKIQVFDVSTPTAPVAGTFIADAGTTYLNGARDIKVSGSYLYVTSTVDDALEIINITTPTAPVHAGSLRDIVRLDNAVWVDIVGNTAYVVNYTGHLGQIINVTNKAAPAFLWQIVDGPAKLNQPYNVIVEGSYAYVASYLSNAIEILDISNPLAPIHVAQLTDDATRRLWGPIDIVKNGNYLYVSAYTDDAIAVINVTTPSAPTYVTAIINSGTTRLDGAWNIYKDGNYLYVASYLSDALEIINITAPAAPVHAGSLQSLNLRLDGARDVKVSGNYAYVSSYLKDKIQVIDVTTKTAPVFTSEITHNNTTLFLDGAWGLELQGNYLYVASEISDALQVIDITNPALPLASGVIRDATNANYRLNGVREIARNGNYLYIASSVDDSIAIIDVETPGTPSQVSRITNNNTTILLDGASGIFQVGNYIYTTSVIQNSVQIIERSRYTTNPTAINTTSIAYSWALSSITETPGLSHSGTLKYQLSKNGGTTWYWYNGTTWATTVGGYTNSSTMAQTQANIAAFDALSGTNNLKIKTFLNSNGTQRSEIYQITINTITDSTAPTISSSFPGSGGLLPLWNLPFTFSYSDSESWVNVSSDILELRKWDGVSAFGANIAATHINFIWETVTATGANYPISTPMTFGRYQFTFKISDIAGNQRTLVQEFYVDRVSFRVSHAQVDIDAFSGALSFGTPELTFEVDTIGAGYKIYLQKSQALLNPALSEITDYDGTQGFWYDKTPYSGWLDAIVGQELIYSGVQNINTNGAINTYTHTLKLWTLVTGDQIAELYEGKLDFIIEYEY